MYTSLQVIYCKTYRWGFLKKILNFINTSIFRKQKEKKKKKKTPKIVNNQNVFKRTAKLEYLVFDITNQHANLSVACFKASGPLTKIVPSFLNFLHCLLYFSWGTYLKTHFTWTAVIIGEELKWISKRAYGVQLVFGNNSWILTFRTEFDFMVGILTKWNELPTGEPKCNHIQFIKTQNGSPDRVPRCGNTRTPHTRS